ncbi:hypothetical protein LWI28_014194 [Acer negundo]|uniref:Serine incorporator n=1 Tax=Acer negundo TaxID=4023 RepID=A0AAD5JKM3_ACENE|nr:hypothetical protein LWI28_014194 [Acer negundo]
MSRSAEAIEAGDLHVRSSNSEIVGQHKSIDCSAEKSKSLRARYIYGILFLVTNLSAWFIRDYAQKVLPQLHFPFFFPSDYIQLYGELARAGAGIFLVLQLVSVIEFIAWWNKYWMPDQERKQRLACSLNIFFVTWTAILLVVMMVISLHSMVNRGLLSSGIMASYIVFLCWSAIRSEPANEICNAQKQVNGNGDWTTILSFLIAICAIVMATFSTGIDSQSFQFRKDKVQLDDDIPYKYGFFHLIFSLGAMYFAMLFISWNLENSARKWSIDVGWASTWVKIVNEWFAASLYLWKLISPTVRQPKVMDHEEPNQQIDDSISP